MFDPLSNQIELSYSGSKEEAGRSRHPTTDAGPFLPIRFYVCRGYTHLSPQATTG